MPAISNTYTILCLSGSPENYQTKIEEVKPDSVILFGTKIEEVNVSEYYETKVEEVKPSEESIMNVCKFIAFDEDKYIDTTYGWKFLVSNSPTGDENLQHDIRAIFVNDHVTDRCCNIPLFDKSCHGVLLTFHQTHFTSRKLFPRQDILPTNMKSSRVSFISRLSTMINSEDQSCYKAICNMMKVNSPTM